MFAIAMEDHSDEGLFLSFDIYVHYPFFPSPRDTEWLAVEVVGSGGGGAVVVGNGDG